MTQEESLEKPRIAYVNVYVSDVKRSVEFFRDVIGLSIEHDDGSFGYASFDVSPIRMGVAQVDMGDGEQARLVGRQTGVGFAVADPNTAHAELERKGVSFSMAPSKQPWGGFMAMFRDPDGNVFYLDELPESP